jgi:hypothetical protein
MATNAHIRRGRAQRRLIILALSALVAAAAPSAADAYGWPLKPFHTQHSVRGFFGDPRIGHTAHGESRTLHFGVDISAPNGTPVYATASGSISIHPLHRDVVVITSSRGFEFSYWHVIPAVSAGQRAVAYRTLIGRIEAPWAHVHFSERRGGVYVNPLRAGALAPYIDRTRPTVHAFGFERRGTGIGRTRLRGRLDLVVEAWDTTPLAVPAPWNDRPVMPAFVRWRIAGPRMASAGWRTAVDFRYALPASPFDAVYAPWTRQNKPWRSGRYRVLLAREWNAASLARGTYRLEVSVTDTRGNGARRSASFTVA